MHNKNFEHVTKVIKISKNVFFIVFNLVFMFVYYYYYHYYFFCVTRRILIRIKCLGHLIKFKTFSTRHL